MNGAQRFLAACAGKPVDRTPVWMMRQAGRYLPEYRAIRERVAFLDLCKSPQLAAEVSLQPVQRFGMDACIVFSDILLPLEMMGASLTFDDSGPQLLNPIRSAAAVQQLRALDPNAKAPVILETLRLVRETVGERTAVVGFCGAPFTLAAYLIEGGGSKTFANLKGLMYSQPTTLEALLDKLAEAMASYAAAQVDAGAQAVQVFDTWAGELAPDAFERFALPYQRRVIESIRSRGVPAILFVNGCAGVLELMQQTGADVLSVDWRITLDAARRRLNTACSLQGNVDPAALLGTPQTAAEAAHAAMRAAGPRGHILNLGHGVLPQTPLECARAFIDAPKSAAVTA